ncbi:hypothetical protein KOY_05281 [Bacillus cereus VDM021]|nr:hypothetical protein KOY_05281 [Bacillus cereus VDM021]
MTVEKVESISITAETEDMLSSHCSYYTDKSKIGHTWSEDDVIRHLITVEYLRLKLEEKVIPNPFA